MVAVGTPQEIHAALLQQEVSEEAELFGWKLRVGPSIVAALAGFLLVDAAVFLALRIIAPGLAHEAQVRTRGALVSCVHDMVAVPAGFFLLTKIVHPAADTQGPFGFGPHSHVRLCWLEPVGAIFIGFLMWDLVHYLMHGRVYRSELLTQLLHHAGFFSMLYLNKGTLPLNYAFPILYLGEISTLFLNLRLIYRSFQWPEMVYSALFALSFFVTRVLFIGAILVQMVLDRRTLWITMGPLLKASPPLPDIPSLRRVPPPPGIPLPFPPHRNASPGHPPTPPPAARRGRSPPQLGLLSLGLLSPPGMRFTSRLPSRPAA
jgi:hypothetical protein